MNKLTDIYNLKDIHSANVMGDKVSVCIIDTGIYPHSFLKGNITSFSDIIHNHARPYDDNGHGTHIAGIIKTMAPGCRLCVVKALDGNGVGAAHHVIKALEWCVNNKYRYNIKILNISIGTKFISDDIQIKYMLDMVERAWDAGIAVVASAGNDGPASYSVTAPGISKKVITVGAMDDMDNEYGSKNYSGRGPTYECIIKPEVVTYGSNIISCSNRNNGFAVRSGTSMATAVVSGAMALVASKYPGITNKEMKILLKETSSDVMLGRNHQGWGALSLQGLLNLKNQV